MSRITVYRYNKHGEPAAAEGWFTPEHADTLSEADPMTADRHKSAMRRGESARGAKETLYHTEEGRWVLKIACHIDVHGQWVDDEADADPELGGPPRYEFIDDGAAIDWMTRNHYDDRLQQYLPDLPDERGPGRPEIGGRVQVRLGHLLPSVDAYGVEHDCSRAEAVRLLVLAGLSHESG